MITIKAFWQKVQTQLKANNPVILAMVMEKKGSAPRGVGAHMLILWLNGGYNWRWPFRIFGDTGS